MEGKNTGLLEQILETIRDIKLSKDINSEEVKTKIVELKTKFTIFRRNQRRDNGKIKEATSERLKTELLELRNRGYENEVNINEILQVIAEDYIEQGKSEEAKGIHSEILGYNGTSCLNMEPEYIKEIIDKKMDKIYEDKPTDIVNVVLEIFQSEKLAINFEKYKDLVEEIIMPLVQGKNELLLEKRIITVINKLAREYKARADYQKAFELSELGAELVQFKDTEEYAELSKELKSLRLYLELEKNHYRTVQIDLKRSSLAEAIRDALAKNGIIDVEEGRRKNFFKGYTQKERERESIKRII